jgi:RecB family exonuclease
VTAARRLIAELAHTQLSDEGLRQAGESLPEGPRFRALAAAKIYSASVRLRREGAFADEATLLEAAVARLAQDGLPNTLRDAGSVWLLLDRPFSPLELAFLLALARACEEARLPLSLEVASSGEPLADAVLEGLFLTLEQNAQSLNFVELVRSERVGPWMEVGARALQAPGTVLSAAPSELQIVVTRSPADEAEEMALRVQQLLAKGVEPRTIGVALFDTAPDEERRVSQALERRAIPVNRSLQTLGATPAARRVLEIFSLPDEDFPVERFARLLPLSAADEPSPQVLLTEAGVRDHRWGAVDGKGGYSVRLEALEQRLARHRPEKAASVRAVRIQCEALLEGLQGLPAEAPLGQLLQRGWALAQRWAFREGEGQVRRLLDQSVQQCARRLGASQLWERRVSRRQVREGLEEAWRRVLVPAIEPGGVAMVDGRRMAGRRFDHLFMVGLEGDRFPATWDGTSLLLDELRRPLNLPFPQGEGRDRLSWVQALGAALGTLTLSFSQSGWGGESRSPSPFVRMLAQAVGVAVPEVPMSRFLLARANTEAELRLAAARMSGMDSGTSAAVAQVLGEEAWMQEARDLAAIETERLTFFSRPEAEPGPYTGLLPATDLLANVLRFGEDRPLSASALGRWGNCAYQGWLTCVLRLEPRESATEDVDPRGQGAMWHAVLERLVPRLERGRAPPDALVDEVIDEVVEACEGRGLACHPALWSLAKQGARKMVQRLIQTGGLFPFEGLLPRKTELPFGSARSDEGWRRVTLPAGEGEEPVFFEGQIDRLDVGEGQTAVLDYKSSGPRSDSDALDGLLHTQFQLPLYLYAARAAGHQGALQAAWVSMKTGEVRTLTQLLAKVGQTVEGLLSVEPAVRSAAASSGLPNLANAVHRLLGPARQGRIPARPQDCRFCGLEAVCRVTQRRVEEAP